MPRSPITLSSYNCACIFHPVKATGTVYRLPFFFISLIKFEGYYKFEAPQFVISSTSFLFSLSIPLLVY